MDGFVKRLSREMGVNLTAGLSIKKKKRSYSAGIFWSC